MTREKQHEINVFIKRYKTCDLLPTPFQVFSVDLCNNTTQKIISVHSLHYDVSNNHMVGQWHPFKLVIFINNQSNTKSSTHHDWRPSWLHLQGHNVTKFTLAPPTHTFLAFHWLPCATDQFLCMFICPWILLFIIYSPQLLIIPHLYIY